MLKDVAVPHVAESLAWGHLSSGRKIEVLDDSCNEAGVTLDGILPAGKFVGLRGQRPAGESQLSRGQIAAHVEGLPVEDLESDQVKMDGMMILLAARQLAWEALRAAAVQEELLMALQEPGDRALVVMQQVQQPAAAAAAGIGAAAADLMPVVAVGRRILMLFLLPVLYIPGVIIQGMAL